MYQVTVLLVSLFFTLSIMGKKLSLLYGEKIVVVGAGLAGLTTAYRLKQEGHEVQVYEALSRPGGRVFTCYFTQGYSELGGMNILDGGQGLHIRALAKELKVPLVNYLINNDFAYCVNESQSLANWSSFLSSGPKPTLGIMNILMQYDNLAEVLDVLFGSDDTILKKFITLRTCGWEGNDCKDLSMLYLKTMWDFYTLYYESAIANNRITNAYCTVKNGMYNLIKALVDKLPGSINYGMPLTRISRTPLGSFTLHFGQTKISADRIVLTLPCSTLRDVVIDDGILPRDQNNMLQTLKYGTNAKILIPTKGTSTRNCGFNDHCQIFYHSSVLWLYFGGKGGIFDASNIKEMSELCGTHIPSIHALYPKLNYDTQIKPIPKTNDAFVRVDHPVGISWVNEPYAKGSYSCLAPGQEIAYEAYTDYRGEKIRNAFRPIENTIFFAGEHTAQEAATMEGAVESGERAARMLLRSLTIKS